MNRYFLPLGAILAAVLALAVPAGASDVLAQASPAPSPSPSATPTPKPFQMSGYLDAGYVSSNVSNGASVVSGRVFDNVSGTPQLQTVNLTAGYTGTLGGKIEINTGSDADSSTRIRRRCCRRPAVHHANRPHAGLSSYTAGKFTLIGGKFETLAGAEVIESPSDLEFSRSILFGFAVPFTHTGARLTFAATPQLNLIVGANRGWDTTKTLPANRNGSGGVAGDSSSLTAELGAAWTPSSVFSMTAQGYTGKVEEWAFAGCANTSCNRSLLDVVGTYHLNSAITVVANGDLGSQTNTFSPSFTSFQGTVNWRGVAGYVSDAFSSKLTGTLRYEVFGDLQGTARNRHRNAMERRNGDRAIRRRPEPHAARRIPCRQREPADLRNKSGATQKTESQFGLEAIVHAP